MIVKTHVAAMVCLTAVAAAVATSTLPAQSSDGNSTAPRAVVSGAQAFILGPTELVASGDPDMVVVSPRGRYALIVHAPPTRPPGPLDIDRLPGGPIRITLWDSQTRRTIPVWRAQTTDPGFSVAVDGFYPGTDTAVLAFQNVRTDSDREPSYQVVLRRFDAVTGTLGAPLEGWGGCATFLPNRPVALLEKDGRFALWPLKGVPQPIAGLPPQSFFRGLHQNGLSLGFEARDSAKGKRRRFLVDAATGAVREVASFPSDSAETKPIPPPITLRSETTTANAGSQAQTVRALWLEAASAKTTSPTSGDKAPSAALVAADHDREITILPDQSGVLWIHDGNVYGRSIARVPRATFENLRATLVKREAMSVAKQMALAILMLAQDNDEVLPAVSEIGETLPYVKNQSLLDRFQYTYTGVREQARIHNPGEITLGHVNAEGGRAVVYADGHVKWEDSPAR